MKNYKQNIVNTVKPRQLSQHAIDQGHVHSSEQYRGPLFNLDQLLGVQNLVTKTTKCPECGYVFDIEDEFKTTCSSCKTNLWKFENGGLA